ncbi:MAG: outer membrane protein assembly factor BamD [bacterium]|nr:outer membrane protein assembly factor BamD [bacterium]
MKRFLLLTVLNISVITYSCGENLYNLANSYTPREQFEIGKRHFAERDFNGAKIIFDRLSRYNIISDFTDSAQYLLAESYFNMHDYILAQSEYNRMVTNLPPGNPLFKVAMFKKAECYNELSPNPALDQAYTLGAIKAYNDFIEAYPVDTVWTPLARQRFIDLQDKLAKKDLDAGILYMKQSDFSSAQIYFDDVLSSFPQTPSASKSLFYKGECYIKDYDYEKAKAAFNNYLRLFPENEFAAKSRQRLAEIEIKIAKIDTTSFR